MLKNFILILCCAIILVFWLTACQSVPGFNLFSSTMESDKAAPHSYFVGAQQVVLGLGVVVTAGLGALAP